MGAWAQDLVYINPFIGYVTRSRIHRFPQSETGVMTPAQGVVVLNEANREPWGPLEPEAHSMGLLEPPAEKGAICRNLPPEGLAAQGQGQPKGCHPRKGGRRLRWGWRLRA